jgi:hypothetical protein
MFNIVGFDKSYLCCAVFGAACDNYLVSLNLYNQNCEILLEENRPLYLSFAFGTTSLSALVWEIYLLQSDVSAQSGTQDRICLSLFLIKLPSESVKEF